MTPRRALQRPLRRPLPSTPVASPPRAPRVAVLTHTTQGPTQPLLYLKWALFENSSSGKRETYGFQANRTVGALFAAMLLALLLTLLAVTNAAAQTTSDTSAGENSAGENSTVVEQGLVTVQSDHDFATTTISLTTALADAGLTIFGIIDHAANAANAGHELPPTTVVLVGNPDLGTPLMQSSRSVAIDLPQKFLIWEDNGAVFVTYNNPQYLVERHGISGEAETIDRIAQALEKFAGTVAGVAAADTQPSTSTTITDTSSMTDSVSIDTSDTVTDSTGTDSTGITATATMTTSPTADVLVQIGERTIAPAEFDRAFQRTMRIFANQNNIPINESTRFFFVDLRNRYLEQFVVTELLLAEAADRGIETSENEAEVELQSLKARFLDDADYQSAIRAAGFASEQELIEAVQAEATINALLEAMRVEIEISEAEIRDYYTANEQLFRTAPGVILPLEQVEEQIRDLLTQQQLQAQIAELRNQRGTEIFTGNLTPFDQIFMSDLGTSSSMTGTESITGTESMTDTESITATDSITASIDVVPADEIPPVPVRPITGTEIVTETETITSE